MATRRTFLKQTGNLGFLYVLPGKKNLAIKERKIDISFSNQGSGTRLSEKDILIDLGTEILELYRKLVGISNDNLNVAKLFLKNTEDYSTIYRGDGQIAKIKNDLYGSYLDNILYDFNCEIVLAPKMVDDSFDSLLEEIHGQPTDSYSIFPIKGSTKVYYSDGSFQNVIGLSTRVYFYYTQNSRWELTFKLLCLPHLVNNEIHLRSFGVPGFYDLEGLPFDPIAQLAVTERKQNRLKFFRTVEDKINQFNSKVEIPASHEFSFFAAPKNVVVFDCIRVLASTAPIRQKNQLVTKPLDNRRVAPYRFGVYLTSVLTKQLLTELLRKKLRTDIAGATVSIAVPNFGVTSDLLFSIDIAINIKVDLYDWKIATMTGYAYVTGTYSIQIIDHFNYCTFFANTIGGFNIQIHIDDIPPIGVDGDQVAALFGESIKEAVSEYFNLTISLDPNDNMSVFFRPEGMTLLNV